MIQSDSRHTGISVFPKNAREVSGLHYLQRISEPSGEGSSCRAARQLHGALRSSCSRLSGEVYAEYCVRIMMMEDKRFDFLSTRLSVVEVANDYLINIELWHCLDAVENHIYGVFLQYYRIS